MRSGDLSSIIRISNERIDESSDGRSAFDFRKNKHKFYQWLFCTDFCERVDSLANGGSLKNIRGAKSKQTSSFNEKSSTDGLVLHHIHMVHKGEKGTVMVEISPQLHGRIHGQIISNIDNGLKEEFYNLYTAFINGGIDEYGKKANIKVGLDRTPQEYAASNNERYEKLFRDKLLNKFSESEVQEILDAMFMTEEEAAKKIKKNGKSSGSSIESRNKSFYNFIFRNLGKNTVIGYVPSADECSKALSEVLGTYDVKRVSESILDSDGQVVIETRSGIYPERIKMPTQLLDLEKETVDIDQSRLGEFLILNYIGTTTDEESGNKAGLYEIDFGEDF